MGSSSGGQDVRQRNLDLAQMQQSATFVNVFIPGSVTALLPVHWKFTRLKQVVFPKRAHHANLNSSRNSSLSTSGPLGSSTSPHGSRSLGLERFTSSSLNNERSVQQLLKVEVVKQELLDHI